MFRNHFMHLIYRSPTSLYHAARVQVWHWRYVFRQNNTEFLSSPKLIDALLALKVNKRSFTSAEESLFRLLTSKIKIIGEYVCSQGVICHLSWCVCECPGRTGTMLGVEPDFVGHWILYLNSAFTWLFISVLPQKSFLKGGENYQKIHIGWGCIFSRRKQWWWDRGIT